METHTEVSSSPTKPMILISAKDVTSASGFITELTEDTAVKSNMEETNRRPWQIVNKYYRVDVEIYVLADNEPCPQELAEHVEAHIIFLADNEDGEDGAALAERRRTAAADAGVRAAVRLLLLDAPAAAAGLQPWARRRGYEPVPLRERATDDPDRDPAAPFAETYGAERARAALHAHAWRGLQRLDRPARPPPPAHDPQPTSSDDDYEGLDDSDDSDDEAAVERAEAFVEALGALGDARAPHELAPDERRRRAERLVAAFCRALGADLPAL